MLICGLLNEFYIFECFMCLKGGNFYFTYLGMLCYLLSFHILILLLQSQFALCRIMFESFHFWIVVL